MSEEGPAGAEDPAVGLCSHCRNARVQASARGPRYWRCARADRDARYLRYPPLPVRTCPGHDEGAPDRSRD
jgi:hypothetical protein